VWVLYLHNHPVKITDSTHFASRGFSVIAELLVGVPMSNIT